MERQGSSVVVGGREWEGEGQRRHAAEGDLSMRNWRRYERRCSKSGDPLLLHPYSSNIPQSEVFRSPTAADVFQMGVEDAAEAALGRTRSIWSANYFGEVL